MQQSHIELAEIFKEKYQEKIKNMHSSENLNKSVEEELSDINNDEVKTDQPSSNLI
ncbi:hypothetical protein [Acinetobacter baumannii]|uniref:hypothetical protein n=1 Tax=Acinetobacter baumannii TaxID=470 RepID=UPI002940ED5A|nr:hypothetical protein [Acinetobacter baumannii]MDV4311557.1 hypothetical protein [Acinetobacter baumannii]